MNPVLALIIANIIWGAAAPIFKLALTNIPPFTLAFLRFFFASLIFLPLAIGHWQKINIKDFLLIIVGAVVTITLHITFFFFGLQKTESINAPIIASSGPVFIYLLSIIILKEEKKLKVFFGMLIALFGVLVIILYPLLSLGKLVALGEVEGNLFLLLATFGAVAHPLLFKNLLKRVNFYMVTFLSFFFGSLFWIPSFLTEMQKWSFSELNIYGFSGIIFGVLFSSALAYPLFNYGLSKISAEEVGIFTYIDPVAAILIAAPLLGEYPNIYFAAGSLLVFGGIFLAENRLHWHPFHRLKAAKI